MLLEITKPQQILEAEGVESTIIIFGGVNIIERSAAEGGWPPQKPNSPATQTAAHYNGS